MTDTGWLSPKKEDPTKHEVASQSTSSCFIYNIHLTLYSYVTQSSFKSSYVFIV